MTYQENEFFSEPYSVLSKRNGNEFIDDTVQGTLRFGAKKLFWKIVKPFSSDKGSNSSKKTSVEENNITSDEEEIANIMNNYFINVTKTLNLIKQLGVGRSGVNELENHISIKMIHEKYPEILPESFKFQLVSNNEVKKETENLDTKKSSTYGSIPATILKQCVNAYLPHLTNSIKYSIQHRSFLTVCSYHVT